MVAREVHGSDDVLRRLGGDRVGARHGGPGIDPAERSGSGRPRRRDNRDCAAPRRLARSRVLDGAATHAVSGDCTLTSRPATSRPSRLQLSSEGQAGSPGRTRRIGPDVADAGAHKPGMRLGRSGLAAAAVRSRRLRFISLLGSLVAGRGLVAGFRAGPTVIQTSTIPPPRLTGHDACVTSPRMSNSIQDRRPRCRR